MRVKTLKDAWFSAAADKLLRDIALYLAALDIAHDMVTA